MKKILLLLLTVSLILFTHCSVENEDEPERIYTKSIERIFSGVFEEGLIEQTENYYPAREEVLEVATPYAGEIPETGYWFYESFDGVLIPFALTGDAVDYFSELIDEFNQNKESNFFISAELEYKAVVSFENVYASPDIDSNGIPVETEYYESVYVVHCTLAWFQYCGSLCAMWIDKERIAVFDEEGTLLKVYLDGPISVPVS